MTHIARPPHPRVQPVTELDDEQQELVTASLGPTANASNIAVTMAHHPGLMRRVNNLGGRFLVKNVITDREREIVILRAAYRAGSEYEFAQHTLIGRAAGLTDAEIVALAREDPGVDWPDGERPLIAMTDELAADDCVSEATWAVLADRLDARQLMEVVMLAGFYRMIAGFLNSFGVALEPGAARWPTTETGA